MRLTLTAGFAALALIAAPVVASEELQPQYAPQAQQLPQAPQLPQGAEPPPGAGHWGQAPEGWVWVPDNPDYAEYPDYPQDPAYYGNYAYGDPGYYPAYIYTPGYYYWAGGRWVWRVARWVAWDNYRDHYAWYGGWPRANYYGYRGVPRARYYGYGGYGGRYYRAPGRSYLRYNYWRDNRPLVNR